MTQELKDAIRTIAEYDVWVFKYMGLEPTFYHVTRPVIRGFENMQYHTSADALLPVFRKAREQWRSLPFHEKIKLPVFGILLDVKDLIIEDDLPAACLKLAEIINQLKEQK